MADNTETTANDKATPRKRVLSGVVVADKMDQTATVTVTRYVKHPKYKKFVKHLKKYHAHNDGNQYTVGDKVQIAECKPLSKTKRFTIIAGTKAANGDEDASE